MTKTQIYKVIIGNHVELVECDSIKYNDNGSTSFVSGAEIIGIAPMQAYVMLETTGKKVFADKLIEHLELFLNKEQLKNDFEIREFLKKGLKMDGCEINSRVQKNILVEELNVIIRNLKELNNAKPQS